MTKKIPLWVALSVGLVFSAVVMVATLLYAAYSYGLLVTNSDTALFTKLQTIQHTIFQEFYKEVDMDKLQDSTIKGFMNGLDDKYAVYYSAEETKANADDIKGQNTGLGVNFIIHPKTGYIYVERVHSKSPADAAVLKEGDSISAIGGTEVTAANYNKLVEDMKSAAGTPVEITVVHSNGKTEKMEIVPAQYSSQSVWFSMIDKTAYVYIGEFDDTTPDQLKAAVEQFGEAENVIFDLRGNPGGTVRSVCSCLDYLLPSGEIIIAHYKDGSSKVLQNSDANAALKIPAVVVVDSSTASSGELFALAMRDISSIPVVGETTFGKGVMQTTYTFEDGSSYKFSTATITSQSRTEYNGVGIVPDVTVQQTADEKTADRLGPIEEDTVIKAALEVFKNNDDTQK